MADHFKKTAEFVWLKNIKVTKYKSEKTGLSFILADVEGPIVEGAFVLSTEAFDDDGCPHTLEHLIFLGSELYPFKGILDNVANRCFASGTNAWTAIDHTAYTIETAGSEGFLNILPIYLDHILFPTITDSGFHTEVHHVNGEGENAGVVYCEMQGRENQGVSRLALKMNRLLFPGKCGYASETGGLMENLRSLKVEKVRDYHKEFYRPENLCLIISGKVKAEDIIQKLVSTEETILSKQKNVSKYSKPWRSPVTPLPSTITESIEFPSEDEESGLVSIAWLGPKWNNFELITSLDILWKYLVDSSVSAFQKVFVEIEDPFASDIDIITEEYSVFVHGVSFEGVMKKFIPNIKNMVLKVLRDVIKTGIDMNRMKDVIENYIQEQENEVEESPHHCLQSAVIGHIVYGTADSKFSVYMDQTSRIKSMKKKKEDFWKDLIKTHLLDQPFVCVEASPSISLAMKMVDEENARTQKQKETLGSSKLQKLSSELDEANQKNNIPIPTEILEMIPVPKIEDIQFIPLTTIRENEVISHDGNEEDLKTILSNLTDRSLPFRTQFDHVPSSFVQLKLMMDTTDLDDSLRPYLELYLDAIFELPIQKGEIRISHEEVVAGLTRDTVTYSNGLGFGHSLFRCGAFSQLIHFEMKTEMKKLSLGIRWMRDLIWKCKFTPHQIQISIGKMLADIPSFKRKGDQLARSIVLHHNFNKDKSNHSSSIFLRQRKFLEELSVRLDNGDKKVIASFEKLRSYLCSTERLYVQVTADLKRLKNVKEQIIQLIPKKRRQQLANQPLSQTNLFHFSSEFRKENAKGFFVIPSAAIETGFLISTCNGLTTFDHVDQAALLVAIEYLTALEGPFWKKIRGLGFSYGYGISSLIDDGLITFYLTKSTNIGGAHQVASEVVKHLAENKEGIQKVSLESSKSTVIFEIISRENTPENASTQSFFNLLRRVKPNYNKQLLSQIQSLNEKDVQNAINKYILPLFSGSFTSISLSPVKLDETIQYFKSIGIPLEEVKSLENHINK
eukprot:TRINITY_DN2936_c0_g3_i1.p1 TRINITY_DN2936_c0_g3~~TRINITY_DN2936_c0_g3_i1.p1  ORF type:complete len:1017 (+),score=266.38 TRINITY_DN2936_c0_g3_i1:107-3157(+)